LTAACVGGKFFPMKLWTDSFASSQPIPPRYALGRPHPTNHVELSDNISPHLAWSEVPEGTRSLVLICHDRDVPSRGEDVNKEGRQVPPDLLRIDFFHLVMVDLPPLAGVFVEGELSRGVTPHGKPGPDGPRGTRCGLNDYTGWFKGDASMEGLYYGYDGPCPPWNDSLVHHYLFALYALDVARCAVEGTFTGTDARAALTGHVLAQAVIEGTYTINSKAK
jgi:phosphatidylethanolamine-binding protein (PEBP) family uncharacterized protein